LGDSLRKNEKFTSYKNIETNSQRSGERSFGINDSVGEVSLFDRDEDTEINIS
jgi:hypothetical protein